MISDEKFEQVFRWVKCEFIGWEPGEIEAARDECLRILSSSFYYDDEAEQRAWLTVGHPVDIAKWLIDHLDYDQIGRRV
jgi:hypothetical protein